MEILPLLILVVSGVLAYIWLKSINLKRRAKEIIDETNQYISEVHRTRRLRAQPTRMILKAGEVCFWNESVELFESRAVRKYQSGSQGIRVAKGIRIGQSRGTSYSKDEIIKISTGVLCITNKRLIYDGDTNDRTINLAKITNISCALESVEIAAENRQKSMIFTSKNPALIELIIRTCIQQDDPQNLPPDFTLSISASTVS